MHMIHKLLMNTCRLWRWNSWGVDRPLAITSQQACAKTLGMSRWAVNPRITTMASCVRHLVHAAWLHLEAWLQRCIPREGLLAYMEKARYDETPMTVLSPGASVHERMPGLPLLPLLHCENDGSSQSAEALIHWSPTVGEKATTKASAQKILQYETTMGALVHASAGIRGVIANCPCRLQLLERCTARVLHQAVIEQSMAGPVSQLFAHRTRNVTTDAAGTNIACEKAWCSSNTKFGEWVSRHQHCEVHVAARIFKSTFSHVGEDITGMIRHALSLNVGANMNLFRQALREEIADR